MEKHIILLKTSGKYRLFRKISMSEKSVCGVDYIEVIAAKNVSMRRFEKFWKSCKNTVQTLILPDNSTADDFGARGLRIFSKSAAVSKLTYQCALRIMQNNADVSERLSVCLADRSGRFAASAEEMMPFCRELKVVTANPYAYFKVADQILAKYGAEPIICSSPLECDLTVIPYSGSIYYKTRRFKVNVQSLSDCVPWDENTVDSAFVILAAYDKNGLPQAYFDLITLEKEHGQINLNDIRL